MNCTRSLVPRLAGLCLLVLLAGCGGEPATEDDRKALIGIWVPAEDMHSGIKLIEQGFVAIRADGTFNFYELKDRIAQRNWQLTDKHTLELVSGNGIKMSCRVLVEGNTLTLNGGGPEPCAVHDKDPLYQMKLRFVKAIELAPDAL